MKKDFKINFTHIYNLFLFLYVSLGFYFSLKTGITSDEFPHQYKWSVNFEVLKKFLLNIGDSNLDLVNYE